MQMHYYSKLSLDESYQIEEGQHIKALYLGEYPISGKVVHKRTKYGWKEQLTIVLDDDLKLAFRTQVYEKGTEISVDNVNVLEVL